MYYTFNSSLLCFLGVVEFGRIFINSTGRYMEGILDELVVFNEELRNRHFNLFQLYLSSSFVQLTVFSNFSCSGHCMRTAWRCSVIWSSEQSLHYSSGLFALRTKVSHEIHISANTLFNSIISFFYQLHRTTSFPDSQRTIYINPNNPRNKTAYSLIAKTQSIKKS